MYKYGNLFANKIFQTIDLNITVELNITESNRNVTTSSKRIRRNSITSTAVQPRLFW